MDVWYKTEEITKEEKSQLVSQLVGNHQNTREKAEAIVKEFDEVLRKEHSEMDSIPKALGYSRIRPNDILNMIKRCFQMGMGSVLFKARGIHDRLYPTGKGKNPGTSEEVKPSGDNPQL